MNNDPNDKTGPASRSQQACSVPGPTPPHDWAAARDAAIADFLQAEAFARRMRERRWMVITGAGDGIMGAGQCGAGRAASFGGHPPATRAEDQRRHP